MDSRNDQFSDIYIWTLIMNVQEKNNVRSNGVYIYSISELTKSEENKKMVAN